MLPVFSFLKFLIRKREIVIDNAAFQLHYRWTVGILLAFSLLVTLKQYWGEAIICIVKQGNNDGRVKETFCWAEVTYSVPSAYNLTVGIHAAYPGVAKSTKDKTDIRYHAYYQWIGLTLFFQATMFCVTRLIWKNEEGGLMRNLVLGCNTILPNEENNIKMVRLVTYLKASWGVHNIYVFKYILCEIVNFVNVVLQLLLMEKFLGGDFSSYGMQMLGLKKDPYGVQYSKYPGYRVFPKVTKCMFHYYGPGGNFNIDPFICILPLNVISEKIYIFLFVWFLALAAASGGVIILRFVSLLWLSYREMALGSYVPLCRESTIQKVCNRCSFSDWFFLKLICKNVSSLHSRKIMQEVAGDEFSECGQRRRIWQNSTETTF